MPDERRPDWKAIVCEYLDLSRFSPEQQNEIVAELAAHLEDLYAENLRQGFSAADAIEHARHELSEKNLSKNIHRMKCKEGTMNTRTKQLLLPGLASITVAIFAPVLLIWTVEWFRFHSFGDGAQHHVAFRFGFVVAYFLGGGIGAYLCRRSGGSPLSRIVVAVLPAIAYLACVLIVLTAKLVEPGHFTTPQGFFTVMYQAVLQPAALLLVGALPFLRSRANVLIAH